jgi:hypothetical protein
MTDWVFRLPWTAWPLKGRVHAAISHTPGATSQYQLPEIAGTVLRVSFDTDADECAFRMVLGMDSEMRSHITFIQDE